MLINSFQKMEWRVLLLCELMGGDIEVESILEKGSTFRFFVPVEMPDSKNEYSPLPMYIADEQFTEFNLLRRYCKEMSLDMVVKAYSKCLNLYPKAYIKEKVKSYIIVNSNEVEGETCLTPAFSPSKIIKLFKGENLTYSLGEVKESTQYKGHILIVEDNKANQMLIKLFLEDYGLSCVIKENGLEAYETFKKEKFDLVLMDAQMLIMGNQSQVKRLLNMKSKKA